MTRRHQIVDADTHVLEPGDLWRTYIDPKYREQAPHVYIDKQGNEVLLVRGLALSDTKDGAAFEKGIGHLGAFGAAWGNGPIDIPYSACKGGYDPHARIRHMDDEGTDAAALYPSLGLVMGGLAEPQFAAACYRAYNRWLADFCRPYPDRLFGAMMVPLQSVDLAIEELRYGRTTLGLRTVFVRPNPCNGRLLHHRDYDPFWQEVQELDISVAVHSGSAGDMPTVGMDRFGDWFLTRHIVTHTMEVMMSAVSIVFCGLCERYPKIRFGFFEGGGGWIAGWLDRFDRHHEKVFADSKLSIPPSELFKRQCWIAFDPGERALPYIVEYIGDDRVLYASDYPHPDGVPNGANFIRENKRLSDTNKQRILSDNAVAFYKLG